MGVCAGAVHGPQRSALGSCSSAVFAPDVECLTVVIEGDAVDDGVTAQALHGRHRQVDACGGFADGVGVAAGYRVGPAVARCAS